MLHSNFTRKSDPSIDGFQFMVEPDPESSIDSTSSTTTSTSSSDQEDEETSRHTNSNGLDRPNQAASNSSSITKDSMLIDGQFNSVDYLIKALYDSLDSVELDKSLVQQSQISGQMNNTSKELLNTIEALEKKLQEHIKKYEQLKKIVPQIIRNINQSEKLAKKCTEKMKKYYPVEYSKSRDKVLNCITEDEEDLYM